MALDPTMILQMAQQKKQNMVTGGLTGVLGYIQYRKATKALKELSNTALPQYSLTPQAKDSILKADLMRDQGFTAPEKNAYMNQLAGANNLSYNRAFNQAPTLSNAISAGIQSNNLNALLRFSAQDADLRRRNIMYSDQLRSRTQDIANRNTGLAVDRRNTAETNWGKAQQVGMNNLITGASLLNGGTVIPPSANGLGGGYNTPAQGQKKMGFGLAGDDGLDGVGNTVPANYDNLA